MFIALGKRKLDLNFQKNRVSRDYYGIGQYSDVLLDQLIMIMAASSIMTYSLYTMAPEVIARQGTAYMNISIPIVIFGISRFMYLISQTGSKYTLSRMILLDKPILVTVALWVAVISSVLYIF
jgi:hypothetical protein|tara:strand:+ start:276 stop:644 length:369 start_codon:yes stop_codon:yes gene_type:complete